ncbi:MAG: hypothetical protein Q8S73_33605 [Deltaproteobacteria bacterium]|nr:hypothetical protein [Myxococcales bacterium]MDP3219083.1 hypothetical protein [Deltaproteobacteria bacterium]
MSAARASLLLLTEDSGRDAHATHEALVRSMLRLIAPGHDASAIAIEPANDAQRDAMRGNIWDSTKADDRPRRIALVKSIATRLCESNLHVVLFHYDGDRRWSDRDTCARHATFEKHIVTPVAQLIVSRTEEQRTRALSRLLTIVPFYSVESWLYQNTPVALRLCEKHHGGQHAATFTQWATDPGALDEEHKPKDAACLSDKFNRALATERFPAKTVVAVGKSFHAAVERLRGSADLVALLAALTPDAG